MVAAAGGAPAVNSRTPRGAPARISAGALAMLISTVGAAQSMVMRSSLISLIDQLGLDAPHAHVRHTARGVDPRERPAVGVEHRQRPQIAVGRRQVMLHERAHHVQVGVAMRDHHALGSRRRPARVVDGEQIAFGDVRLLERGLMLCERRLVVDPALARAFQRDEVLDTPDLAADALNGLDIVTMRADDLRAAMVDDVLKIVRAAGDS